MPEPRVGIDNLVWLVRVSTVVLVAGGLGLSLGMRRRGVPLRNQKWYLASFFCVSSMLFIWLIGMNMFAALAAGAVVFALSAVILAGVDVIQKQSESGGSDS